ncbi:MAG: sugar ABC transporter ATP-binding protein [Lachnospiraceae bacterium]|nr:sugar ABC transporter ATP-binding protein [Lachnospiraceae bacterium]
MHHGGDELFLKDAFLQVKNVSKSFFGNRVLSNVSAELRPGEFLALIGENGAGKSTLINLITGIYSYDEGEIWIDGKLCKTITPAEAQRLGIHTVRQELSINPVLTVTQNVFLGHEILKRGLVDKKEMERITRELLDSVHLNHIDPKQDAGTLTMAEKQMLEFCKAVYQNPRLLVLDEATSALDDDQVEILFNKLRELQKNGLMVIFISHRLHELYELCNIMTVLKDGQQIVTEPIQSLDEDRLISLMTGRAIADLFPAKRDSEKLRSASEVVKIENGAFGKCKNISFTVKKGEILGIGGLQGQGQQTFLECLFGMRKLEKGTMLLDGQPVTLKGPSDAMDKGIAYLPAERKTEGLFVSHPIAFNLTFACLGELSNAMGTIIKKKEKEEIDRAFTSFSIKANGPHQIISELSGGNQQKVVLAKWLARNPKLLLLNEPTRGIDVGTKKEIYELMARLAEKGVSIVMISSDTMELIGMCDRVITVYENQINFELLSNDLTEESLVKASVFRRDKNE